MKTTALSVLRIIIILSMGIYFHSCDDNDTTFTAYADVFVQKEKVDDVAKYAKVCYIYAYSPMNSATVTLPNGTDMELEAYETNNYFYNEANSSVYEELFPFTGTYYFTATYDEGQVFESSDILEPNELELPNITSIFYDNDYEWLFLKWDDVSEADAYIVRMYSSDGEIIFNSQAISESTNEYYFDTIESTTWYEDPIDNTSYSVTLTAILFDNDATEADQTFNIQCYSITEAEIIWNPAE